MRVLSIGNSFSQDAQRYLHRIAKNKGVDLTTANLNIGGCSLETHHANMLADKADYDLEFNGEPTGIKISIRQILENSEWDVVTLQQASGLSAYPQSYSPYLTDLANYVRKLRPQAKIYIHQTWAYEDGSNMLKDVTCFKRAEEMFENVKSAYENAVKLICADGLIPCGEAMFKATQMGMCVHRDSFHASYGAGRYLLSLTWLKTLTGKEISDDDFNLFDEPVSKEEREIVIKAVNFATSTL